MIWDTLAAMPADKLAAFVTGGLVLNLAPGQDVFFASASGIRGGPKVGALAGFGVGLGVLVHVTLATLGLSAVLAAHPAALAAIKWAGAGYLLVLAWKSWRAGARPDQALRGAQSPWRAIRSGVLSNLLNPKPVLFLLAFLPQFTNPAYGPIWHQIAGLGLIFATTGTLVTMGYGILAGLLRQGLAARLGLLNRVAAVMFAGLALRLATN
ncbi:LysE family translocator [Paracoccus sp. p4-l81]|uniref:LysE family translocator n=1 Tax=unclassified Paracoccus (in: a-proteobacteria) TaxID=2688777 RepID=UPI0035B6F592